MDSRVIHGDAVEVVPTLGKFPLIFADCPFNIGHGYDGYADDKPTNEFNEFIDRLIDELWEACDGVLILYGNDYLAERYILAANRLAMPRRAWLNWHYRFGQNTSSNWVDSRTHALVFTKHKQHTWNPDAVRVPSDRATVYKDKRIHATPNGGIAVPRTIFGIPSDGEGWGRVTGNSKERWKKHPNQLPIRLMRRLILAYSNPGDWILDPCTGSGTTGLVATREGRNFVGCDYSLANVTSATERIKVGYYPDKF